MRQQLRGDPEEFREDFLNEWPAARWPTKLFQRTEHFRNRKKRPTLHFSERCSYCFLTRHKYTTFVHFRFIASFTLTFDTGQELYTNQKNSLHKARSQAQAIKLCRFANSYACRHRRDNFFRLIIFKHLFTAIKFTLSFLPPPPPTPFFFSINISTNKHPTLFVFIFYLYYFF